MSAVVSLTFALTWSNLPSFSIRLLPVSLPTVSLALPPQYWAVLLNLLLAMFCCIPAG